MVQFQAKEIWMWLEHVYLMFEICCMMTCWWCGQNRWNPWVYLYLSIKVLNAQQVPQLSIIWKCPNIQIKLIIFHTCIWCLMFMVKNEFWLQTCMTCLQSQWLSEDRQQQTEGDESEHHCRLFSQWVSKCWHSRRGIQLYVQCKLLWIICFLL